MFNFMRKMVRLSTYSFIFPLVLSLITIHTAFIVVARCSYKSLFLSNFILVIHIFGSIKHFISSYETFKLMPSLNAHESSV